MSQNIGSFMGGFAYMSIALTFIKSILEIFLYMSAITLAFKGVKALNIYINKNSL